MHLITYTDGGARGNPGPAGVGVVIYERGKNNKRNLIEKFGRYIGETTNNQAEYKALLEALKRCRKLKADEVECYLDSELAVKQLNREYKVKNKELAPTFVKVWNETIHFKKIRFTHIPRERNKLADSLVNEAIDNALK